MEEQSLGLSAPNQNNYLTSVHQYSAKQSTEILLKCICSPKCCLFWVLLKIVLSPLLIIYFLCYLINSFSRRYKLMFHTEYMQNFNLIAGFDCTSNLLFEFVWKLLYLCAQWESNLRVFNSDLVFKHAC